MSQSDIPEMESRMPEAKANPPFDKKFSEDVLNLMLDKITFLRMQFLMFVVIHNILHSKSVIMSFR